MIHIGSAHPNDDGLLAPSIKGPIFLQENSRPVWTHHEPHHDGCSLVPSRPETILEDGLMFMGVRLLGWPIPGPFGIAIYEGGRHEAKDLILDDTRTEVTEVAKGFADTEGRKVVIAVMHGSSLLSQLPTLEAWPGLEVEVLTPAYVRVSNRWTPDIPVIIGDLRGD
jgi:hypothetical protein